jgi:lipoate-protein ligase A
MLIIKSDSNDAYFNIALEEYLLKNYDEEFFITAINEPSIIVGVNQDTYQEINALYVRQNNVKVVRRLSGGGTVFQDHGNINFSHIYKDDGSDINDFSKGCNFIMNFILEKLEISTEFAGRNDLIIDGKKFSGHARIRIDDKILHHGTLLISSNMKSLTDALKFNDAKYADRALRSNHERVTNLSEHINESLSTDKVGELFLNYIRSVFHEAKMYSLTKEDVEAVNALVLEKYSTWDWNYGSEVNIPFYKHGIGHFGNYEIYLNEEEGVIKDIKIFGDFFSQKNIIDIENALIGCSLSKDSVLKVLSGFDFDYYMSGANVEDFAQSFDK